VLLSKICCTSDFLLTIISTTTSHANIQVQVIERLVGGNYETEVGFKKGLRVKVSKYLTVRSHAETELLLKQQLRRRFACSISPLN